MSTQQQHPSGNVSEAVGLSRYDLLLGSIPLPLLAGVIAGLLTGGPLVEELATGAALAAVLTGYGLFIDAPV